MLIAPITNNYIKKDFSPLKNYSKDSSNSQKPCYSVYNKDLYKKNNVVFLGNVGIPKTFLSSELRKAFASKDPQKKYNYFKNLAENHSILLRNCDDNEYINVIQVMLDNVKYNELEGKETFKNQIKFLNTAITTNEELTQRLNPKTFKENVGNLIYDDEEVLRNINEILTKTQGKASKISIDISSHSTYPINILSNFAETDLEFDGVKIKSIEGFLQSLKTPNIEEQRKICAMDGIKAKGAGKKLNKKRNYDFRHFFWNGKKYERHSEEYKNLIKSVYQERYKNDDEFRFALEYTKDYDLTHKMGEKDPKRTILTEEEFINILNELRQNH